MFLIRQLEAQICKISQNDVSRPILTSGCNELVRFDVIPGHAHTLMEVGFRPAGGLSNMRRNGWLCEKYPVSELARNEPTRILLIFFFFGEVAISI